MLVVVYIQITKATDFIRMACVDKTRTKFKRMNQQTERVMSCPQRSILDANIHILSFVIHPHDVTLIDTQSFIKFQYLLTKQMNGRQFWHNIFSSTVWHLSTLYNHGGAKLLNKAS